MKPSINIINQIWGFARKNLFNSPFNVLLTIVMAFVLGWGIAGFLSWALVHATWVADSASQANPQGATWAFIAAKLRFFLVGFYPLEEVWRMLAGLIILIGLLVPFVLPRFRKKLLWAGVFIIAWPGVILLLIAGGLFLPYVPSNEWGGLALTLILSSLGLVLSFPLGVLLALGRRSEMWVIRGISIGIIEFFRGVPLITILFMVSVVAPFFFPPGAEVDKLVRVVIGMTLFQAAYLAEVVRGGLQSLPKGQYEAADSLGLTYTQQHYLVILPQALKITVSNIGGISISFIKDTSLVLIIGMFDLLGIVRPLSNDPNWLGMEPEGLIFSGLIFWLICFLISSLTNRIEKRVNQLPQTQVTTLHQKEN